MLWILIPFAIIFLVTWLTKEKKEELNELDLKGKSVFISGCDTGFGNGLALKLHKRGLKVYAGCLTENGANKLKEEANNNNNNKSNSNNNNNELELETIICDITKEEDIRKAKEFIESKEKNGLWAVVNNAGVGMGGDWDWIPEKYFQLIMNVNFFGHVNITRAFLPLLKKGKGRVVNLTSVAGYFAAPGMGAYACSKFAMEAFSDSLRREMRKWGVSVYIVEPGFTATPMVLDIKAAMQRVWADVSEEKKQEYGEEYGKALGEIPGPLDNPETVINALQAKVILKHPTPRTRVGQLATVAFILNMFPTSWADAISHFTQQRMSPSPLPSVLIKKKN